MTDWPSGKYGAILADPPWKYYTWSLPGYGTAETYYPTLSNEEIIRLPVVDLAADDCALFL